MTSGTEEQSSKIQKFSWTGSNNSIDSTILELSVSPKLLSERGLESVESLAFGLAQYKDIEEQHLLFSAPWWDDDRSPMHVSGFLRGQNVPLHQRSEAPVILLLSKDGESAEAIVALFVESKQKWLVDKSYTIKKDENGNEENQIAVMLDMTSKSAVQTSTRTFSTDRPSNLENQQQFDDNKFVMALDAMNKLRGGARDEQTRSFSSRNSYNPSQHIHVVVTKNVPPNKQEEWLAMANELALETWKEDGCISYDFVRSKENSDRFVIVEEWESDAKLEAHFSTPHFTTLVPIMDGMSTTVELDVSKKCLAATRLQTVPSKNSSSKEHVHVTVTKDVPPEKQSEWLAMAETLAEETWKEDGCVSYNFVRSNENPNRFVIVEEWESQSKLDAHFSTPHFTRLVPLMDDMSTTVQLDVSHKCLSVERHLN
uniref:ABM domain-containing protein n=1 Tax=Entomoneis paludosa TaxID=265537 RepID=A0A7S2YQD0_9STRA